MTHCDTVMRLPMSHLEALFVRGGELLLDSLRQNKLNKQADLLDGLLWIHRRSLERTPSVALDDSQQEDLFYRDILEGMEAIDPNCF